jgi:hypothetical protein
MLRQATVVCPCGTSSADAIAQYRWKARPTKCLWLAAIQKKNRTKAQERPAARIMFDGETAASLGIVCRDARRQGQDPRFAPFMLFPQDSLFFARSSVRRSWNRVRYHSRNRRPATIFDDGSRRTRSFVEEASGPSHHEEQLALLRHYGRLATLEYCTNGKTRCHAVEQTVVSSTLQPSTHTCALARRPTEGRYEHAVPSRAMSFR